MLYIKSRYQKIIVISIKVLSIIIIFITVNSDIDSKGFYTFLRVFIFLTSSFAGYLAYLRDDKKGIIFFSIIAVLFNPIIPIYGFTKNVWILIDVFTVCAFIYSIVNYLGYTNLPLIKANSIKKDEHLPQSSTDSFYAQKYFKLASEMEKNADISSLFGKSRLETALILYRDSIKCNPNMIDAYINIGYITLRLQHDYHTDFNKAIDEIDSALKTFSDKPELYKLRGMIVLCKSRRIILSENEKRANLILEGINNLSEYLKSNPDDEQINELKGESYYELEKINPVYIASLFLEAGSRGIGKWAQYYVKKKHKSGTHRKMI